ncbi:hypothetical protein AMECASPLE_004780 [Ameca splendens]|uniref:Uncharacterized protein n=1 Tax=Ameca splendens TaxID=208324 RepID=A0ABV0YWW9_9TELE
MLCCSVDLGTFYFQMIAFNSINRGFCASTYLLTSSTATRQEINLSYVISCDLLKPDWMQPWSVVSVHICYIIAIIIVTSTKPRRTHTHTHRRGWMLEEPRRQVQLILPGLISAASLQLQSHPWRNSPVPAPFLHALSSHPPHSLLTSAPDAAAAPPLSCYTIPD